jgi:RsiW-degrading membrane proteinase PrsW (M82 family)
MLFLASVALGFLPMFLFAAFIYWLDRYEREPLILLGAVFVCGAAVAAGGAFFVNTVSGIGIFLFTGSEGAAEIGTASLVAPVVEESLKGAAEALVLLLFRSQFDSVLDGGIYGGITAIGFAATENAYYLYDRGFSDGGWERLWRLAFVRIVLVGWQHPFYTAFTGIGLALSRLSTNAFARVSAPLGGLALAIAAHAFHNTFADLVGGLAGLALGTILDWFGWAGMLAFIVWLIVRERNLMRRQLHPEMLAGLLTEGQYQNALSPFHMSTVFLGGRGTMRFYQLAGRLAHKKEQLAVVGEEAAYATIVQTLRTELASLSPQVAEKRQAELLRTPPRGLAWNLRPHAW